MSLGGRGVVTMATRSTTPTWETEGDTWETAGDTALLRRHGFTCAPERVHARGHVELRVRGEVVFTCRVTDLEFGGDGGIDPLCQAALRAVQNAV
uniref:UPF0728 protein C10orf53 homolog isoform X2 n=1 Tax=Petromyzon marinus TaxID=7757 RepID=A0AAJ7WPX2_PETMA|nr:UPF0728 protein C10orf53 homolog isoform X2 [Petromyzon marinus]